MFVLQPANLFAQSLHAIFSLLSHGSKFLVLSESDFADFVYTGDTSKAHTKLAEP
jgi:hypothetical protein